MAIGDNLTVYDNRKVVDVTFKSFKMKAVLQEILFILQYFTTETALSDYDILLTYSVMYIYREVFTI